MRTAAYIFPTDMDTTTLVMVVIVTLVFVASIIVNVIGIRRFRRR